MLLSMSASVGFGLSLSSAAPAMFITHSLYPHCGTSWSSQACCTLCSTPFCANPSIVVICRPATKLNGTEQERIAMPSTCTVQAPQERRVGIDIDLVTPSVDVEISHLQTSVHRRRERGED